MLISKFGADNIKYKIDSYEKIIGKKLPNQLCKFLEKYNGGETPNTHFSSNNISSDIRAFYGLGEVKYSLDKVKPVVIKNDMYLPVAFDSFGNDIIINLSTGEIYFKNQENDKIKHISNNFNSFIDICESRPVNLNFIESSDDKSNLEKVETRNYFRSDGSYIYLEADSAEFYIPKSYFETTGGFAEDKGDIIQVLGIFDVGIFKDGKLLEMKVLNIPTWIDIFAIDSEDRNVSLPSVNEPVLCKVLKYQKGHKIMNAGVVEDSSNVESFLNFIMKGKIPPIVPYEKALQIWMKNQSLNSANLGVPSVIEELVLSVSYRYKKDPGKKFSHVIGKDLNVSQYDYIMNNIRQICQYTSTFTALTFEDIDSMITTSLNRTRTKGEEAFSPLEDLIKL